MKRIAMVFALAGCDAVFGLDSVKPPRDAVDSGGDCSQKVGEYGKPGNRGWFQFCPVGGDVTLDGAIDTDSGAQCAAHETTVCLIEGARIVVTQVSATGTRPLVLSASVAIHIQGALDVSSSQAGNGPAANDGRCAALASGAAGTVATGGGGGAGGSWHTTGGNGGNGGGGVGGVAAVAAADNPTTLRGGCAGAPGGRAVGGGGAGGGGGGGGGAVYLMSPQISLDSSSLIKSVGMYGRGGGGGATLGDGGGGGGAGGTGGLIVFDTLLMDLPSAGGFVFANGGGGGAGGSSTHDGLPGQQSMGPQMAGGGGRSVVNGGGDGGSGAVGLGTGGIGISGSQPDPTAAGGGGGGGQGVIMLFSTGPVAFDTRFSPPVID